MSSKNLLKLLKLPNYSEKESVSISLFFSSIPIRVLRDLNVGKNQTRSDHLPGTTVHKALLGLPDFKFKLFL